MSTLVAMKIMDQQTKDIVHGYTRCVQDSFPDDSIFYTISEIIIHWILLYVHPHDIFDAKNTHCTYKLSQDKLAVTKEEYSNEGCCYLTRRAEKGIHTWQFRLTQVDPDLYSVTIGVYKTTYALDPSDAVRTAPGKYVYGWMLCDDEETYLVGDGQKAENENYAKSCQQGDIVEMILNLNESNFRYKVNGEDYGIAFDNIEETEYVATVSMYEENDTIEIMSYTCVAQS